MTRTDILKSALGAVGGALSGAATTQNSGDAIQSLTKGIESIPEHNKEKHDIVTDAYKSITNGKTSYGAMYER